MRLVSLIRVSTEDQVANTSLQTQEADIIDYCRIHGHEVVEIPGDQGSQETGYDLAQRPNFQAALKLLRDGAADGLVVWKLDRYARNALQGLAIFQLFERKGWHLISVRDQIDTSSPMGRAFFQLALVFAELQRNEIVWRVRLGQEAKKAAGGYAGGRPPYGWDAVDGELVENEAEQALIQQMCAWEEEGYDCKHIAAKLNDQGLCTKSGVPWTYQTVRRVVRPQHKARAVNPATTTTPLVAFE